MSLVKKVLVFFSVLVNASVCHPAEWEIYRHKGDDLEGIAPYVSYGYGNQTGSVVLYDNFSTIKFVSGQYSNMKRNTLERSLCTMRRECLGFIKMTIC